MYLCYDIKGIQTAIFCVPKLKAIIGGSAQIDAFDTDAEPLGASLGAHHVFSGGGRGAFYCGEPAIAKQLETALVKRAHLVGLDLRIGCDKSLSEAAHRADRLFPFIPESLEGDPCVVSGLWPRTGAKILNVRRGVHPIIFARLQDGKKDQLGAGLLADLRDRDLLPAELANDELQFFRNILAPSEKDEDLETEEERRELAADKQEAVAASWAIGGRNRWAVIAMDGNDMGRQFLAFQDRLKDRRNSGVGDPDTEEREWIERMSRSLKRITRQAFLEALGYVLELWVADLRRRESESSASGAPAVPTNRETLRKCRIGLDGPFVLPFRPLILGGDDITLLAHPAYALHFVQRMARRFEELSVKEAELDSTWGPSLWPATGGRLTISAGVLSAKTSIPLDMAIEYAESLLGSAKGRFRVGAADGPRPAPAAVDWESITETLVDTPAERRKRELVFDDGELDQQRIQLTQRPYLLQSDGQHPDLDRVSSLAEELATVPTSVRARVLPNMRKSWSERTAFLASIAKRHRRLQELLWEDGESLGSGWRFDNPERDSRSTPVLDALLLLEEEHRLRQTSSIV